MTMEYDILIVGAGPAGLALGCSLAGTGLKTVLVEKSSAETLAAPAPDGRAIALTQGSMDLLDRLDVTPRFLPGEASPLRQAHVLDGKSPFALVFADRKRDGLGWLVPNHAIRRALHGAFRDNSGAELFTGVSAESVRRNAASTTVTLSDGREITARLLVAADTRFSGMRQKMGISAFMHDFGRTMIVCDMEHDVSHGDIALECFFYEMTIATLPLSGQRSSIVLTMPTGEASRIMAMAPQELADDIGRRLGGRLGGMRPAGERHAYPLVAVYARKFAAERFALIGDAAVGMHPVTAHGFNFGLASQHVLAKEIKAALARDEDFAAEAALSRYERAHRLATFALFHATNGIADLYSNESLPARLVRQAGLRAANLLPPFKSFVVNRLTARAT